MDRVGTTLLERLSHVLQSLWLPALLVMLWWFLSAGSTSFYFPPLSDILWTLWREMVHGTILGHLFASLGNVALGLGIAILVGISLGLAIGQVDALRDVLWPMLNFFRAMPASAIVPIIIIGLGIGAAPKILIIALACLWPILLNTVDGVRGTSLSVRETARAYRIPAYLRLTRISLPAAMPQILAGIRVALPVSLALMVIAELFGGAEGIGFYVSSQSGSFAMREAWAGTILIGIIGYLSSAAFVAVERAILAWYFRDARRLHRRPAAAVWRGK